MTKLISTFFWLLRALLLLLFFLFAVKNIEPVTLHFWFGQTWEAPLVLVLGAFLFGGVVLGLLGCLARLLRQRRDIARLKRELRVLVSERGPSPSPPDIH
jgi:putative membrane protein